MPYALIPDGYSLKKVTKLQKQAVNDKRRHDDIVALLNNDLAAVAIVAPIVAVLSGTFGSAITKFVLDKLKQEGVSVSDKVKGTIEGSVKTATTFTGIIGEAVQTGRVSGGAPVSIDVEDLPEALLNETLKRLGFKKFT